MKIFWLSFIAVAFLSTTVNAAEFSCEKDCTGIIKAKSGSGKTDCDVIKECGFCANEPGLTKKIRNMKIKSAIKKADPDGSLCRSSKSEPMVAPSASAAGMQLNCDKDCTGEIHAKPGSGKTDCDVIKECGFCANEPGLTKKIRNMKIKSAIKKADPDGSLCRSQK